MTDASNLLLRRIPRDPDYTREKDPELGTLIPSPFRTHTHVYALFPFEPVELFVKDVVLSSYHKIENYPSWKQPAVRAGQDAVVKEMAKLRMEIRQIRIGQALPTIIYDTANRPTIGLEDREFWRRELGWAGSPTPEEAVQTRNYVAGHGLKAAALNDRNEALVWDHAKGEWMTKAEQTGMIERRIVSELRRIDEVGFMVQESFEAGTYHAAEEEGTELDEVHTAGSEAQPKPSTKGKDKATG